jgi:hypothetical protein
MFDSEVAESDDKKPSDALLMGGRRDRRLRVLLFSTDSSGMSDGNVVASAFGEVGSDLSFQGNEGRRKCVDCGRSVSFALVLTASWHTRTTVGSVFLTNWLRVMRDSMSAMCRSVLSNRIE